MPPDLTIRNLTINHVELKLVERFEAVQVGGEGPKLSNMTNISGITKTFNSLMSNVTGPTSPEIAAKSESFSQQDVNIRIGAFETNDTDIKTNDNEVIRLTFEAEGQRYRIDVPTPSKRSAVLSALSPDPKLEFTAVYLPNHAYLTLYSSAKLASWMGKLKNEISLSALSIPGTHNSPTCHTALPSVRCQAVTVREQLDNGVRFLDIRAQPENPDDPSKDGLILVHSAFPISLTGNKYFRDLQNTVYEFLDANPSETVIISLKREGTGKASDQQFSKILNDHYTNDRNRWFTDNRIPTIGEVRKKIVLLRRFNQDDSLRGLNDGRGLGIDGASWPDNCADGLCSSGEIRVQDFYEVAESQNIEKKIKLSTDHLERSAECQCVVPGDKNEASAAAAKQPFFVNFLSASNFFRPDCWPDKVAAKINPSVVEHLCREHNHGKDGKKVGDGCTGIVVCDWVGNNGDWDLVRCIVGMNAKLQTK